MILVIDNYDSFTYNLVQILGKLKAEIIVFRNDRITLAEIKSLNPDGIVISPGPGTPAQAGISKEVIRTFYQSIPLLGICLGHQSIGEVFDGRVISAPLLMHGKTSQIYHKGDHLFSGIENPFEATRYHSLIVEEETFPDELEITARSEDGIIMGLAHKHFPVYGLQFHPESILTTAGETILSNFIGILTQYNKEKNHVTQLSE